MPITVLSGRVSSEGDNLYYEARGNGIPLLLVPGAGGDGNDFRRVAEILSDEFRVITYDRRANARSTCNEPQNFSLEQQSRDILAVMKALGVDRAHIVGNSSGAVIALNLAISCPDAILSAVIHEPPMARLHPKSKHWQKFFSGVYRTSFTLGSGWALLQFLLGSQLPVGRLVKAAQVARSLAPLDNEPRLDRHIAAEILARHELLTVTNYLPDLKTLGQRPLRIFAAAGKESLTMNKWYAQNAQIIAEQLGTPLIVFPGHHGSFLDQPEKWSEVLRSALKS